MEQLRTLASLITDGIDDLSSAFNGWMRALSFQNTGRRKGKRKINYTELPLSKPVKHGSSNVHLERQGQVQNVHSHDNTQTNTQLTSRESLPGEEIQVLVLDFLVGVGVQGGQEGGLGGGLGPLGSVAVLDSRSSQGSPRHTGVLGGPVTSLYEMGFLSWM